MDWVIGNFIQRIRENKNISRVEFKCMLREYYAIDSNLTWIYLFIYFQLANVKQNRHESLLNFMQIIIQLANFF